jgi:hypothetical protein
MAIGGKEENERLNLLVLTAKLSWGTIGGLVTLGPIGKLEACLYAGKGTFKLLKVPSFPSVADKWGNCPSCLGS